jgi:ribosomal protein S18 acetylase RimI-like enzyme
MNIVALANQNEAVFSQILSLHKAAYRQEAMLLGLSSLPGMDRSASDIRALKEVFFGVYAQGELAGAISVEEESPGCLTICSLTVLPAHHRRGIGRALLRYIIGWKPELWTRVSTAADNAGAIALYQDEGFVVCGESLAPGLALKLVHLCRKSNALSHLNPTS